MQQFLKAYLSLQTPSQLSRSCQTCPKLCNRPSLLMVARLLPSRYLSLSSVLGVPNYSSNVLCYLLFVPLLSELLSSLSTSTYGEGVRRRHLLWEVDDNPHSRPPNACTTILTESPWSEESNPGHRRSSPELPRPLQEVRVCCAPRCEVGDGGTVTPPPFFFI